MDKEAVLISSGANGFFYKGQKFTPSIVDFACWEEDSQVNVVKIAVDLSVSSDLSFSRLVKQAKQVEESGLFIFWELDFKLASSESVEKTTLLLSQKLAIEEFVKQLFIPFEQACFGASVYKGVLSQLPAFLNLSLSDENFREFLRTKGLSEQELEEAFSKSNLENITLLDAEKAAWSYTELLAFKQSLLLAYLYELMAYFPENIRLFILSDLRQFTTMAQQLRLSLADDFEFFSLALQGANNLCAPIGALAWDSFKMEGQDYLFSLNSTTLDKAFLVPRAIDWRADTMHKLSEFCGYMRQKNQSYRFISEAFFIDEWEGLDELWLDKNMLDSALVRRKIQGFQAAGGSIHLL